MIKLKRIPHNQINTYGGKCRITAATDRIVSDYESNPNNYNNGTSKFIIDNVYSHDNIKLKLKEIQKNKCAFCEINLESQHGEVEHFRPKRMYKQNPKDSANYPGYYWLSYSWDNLLLSCITCNQKWKKNLFPIKRPEKRAKNHYYNILYERPYFINPYIEEPSNFIRFKGPMAEGVDKCNRGKITIKYFNLNRSGQGGINSIYELRKGHFDKLSVIYESLRFIPKSNPLYLKAIDNIIVAKRKNEEYSAMVKDNFPI